MDGQFKLQMPPPTGKDIICGECTGIYFDMALQLQLVKGLAIGKAKDTMQMTQVPICRQCGTPLDPDNLIFKEDGEDVSK